MCVCVYVCVWSVLQDDLFFVSSGSLLLWAAVVVMGCLFDRLFIGGRLSLFPSHPRQNSSRNMQVAHTHTHPHTYVRERALSLLNLQKQRNNTPSRARQCAVYDSPESTVTTTMSLRGIHNTLLSPSFSLSLFRPSAPEKDLSFFFFFCRYRSLSLSHTPHPPLWLVSSFGEKGKMSDPQQSRQRPLYDVLGVSQNATDSDIARAYRRLALTCHPDRNPDGAEEFKRLSNAYAILSDKEKRSLYDLTGVVPGSSEDPRSGAGDSRSTQEHSNGIKEQVAMFFKTYVGSEEEKSDFAESYAKADGDFRRMVRELLVFDNGVDTEVRRLYALGTELLSSGRLQVTPRWRTSTTPKGIAKSERDMRKEREEADEVLKEMGLDEESQRRAKEARENGDLGALQTLIQQRQQTSWQSMMASLEAKYVDKEKEEGESRRTAKAKKGSTKACRPETGKGSSGSGVKRSWDSEDAAEEHSGHSRPAKVKRNAAH